MSYGETDYPIFFSHKISPLKSFYKLTVDKMRCSTYYFLVKLCFNYTTNSADSLYWRAKLLRRMSNDF